MQLSTFAAILAYTAVTAAQSPIIMDFSVQRASGPKTGTTKMVRVAAQEVDLVLENEYLYYLALVDVGTPGQKMVVDVDTGSSDMWLPAADSGYKGTPFDATKSSTFKKVADDFKIGYGDGSKATGYWAEDTVSLGGVQLSDVQFGYATNTTVKQGGLLGVGYTTNEASAQLGSRDTYDNLPVQLKKQGKINKVAYSLYLNLVEADAGSILFGAIDHAKYEGHMQLMDVVNIDDAGRATKEPTAFFVPLQSISQSGTDLTSKPYPALLDSGTTLIYAPDDIALAVAKKLGAVHIPFINMYVGSCTPDVEDIEFNFGKVTVKVKAKDLMFKPLGPNSKPFLNRCIAGFMNSPADYYILGDAFLRSAYAYYDLEANQVGVAQVKYTNATAIEYVK